MRGGAFGVVALVGDIEAGFVKPGSIVVGGGVAPPHRGCAAQPVGFAAGPSGLTGGEEQPAAGPQPAGDPEEQPGLFIEGHVNDGVEKDDRVQGGRLELRGGGVGAVEAGAGDEAPGPFYLPVADVDPGDLVAGGCQVPVQGDAAAAAQVEQGGRGWQSLEQLSEPACVGGRAVVIPSVSLGQRVVAAPAPGS